MRVYCIIENNHFIPRYLCGVKANIFTIGVNGKVVKGDCRAAVKKENQVNSIVAWAQKAGKGTGIVTTTRITHASPAGTYAHTSHRDHESDSDIDRIAADSTDCCDIAKQLILDEPGRSLDVIFGGGRAKFLPIEKRDAEGKAGNRTDGNNLISIWKKYHPNGRYITTKEELKKINMKRVDSVLGLFAASHMEYHLDDVNHAQPSLKEMTEGAIKLLSKHREGYFLFVEGGRIDHAHHDSLAAKALDETVQFSEAIQAAIELTRRDDTLIVVSSDHSHTMSINGYPYRGNNILGVGNQISEFGNYIGKTNGFYLNNIQSPQIISRISPYHTPTGLERIPTDTPMVAELTREPCISVWHGNESHIRTSI